MARDGSPRAAAVRYSPAFAASLFLHTLALAIAAGWLNWIPTEQLPPRPREATIVAFVVPPEDPRFPGLNPIDAMSNAWLDVDDLATTETSAEFTFEIARITERAHLLFPFLTPGLVLERFALRSVSPAETSLRNPFASATSRQAELAAARPLTADDGRIQRLVDQSWSRRNRWSAFEPIRRLARTHDGNTGKLPALLQRYTDQNALQMYSDSPIRDPRLWVQLGLVANHVDFIGYIRRYAGEHPSTKATTALLFLLDVLAQGSMEVLQTLLESDPSRDLQWTRTVNPGAHELLARIQRHYRRELGRRGVTSSEGITVFYESVRLSILSAILQATPNGYRASDARFLAGAIYWRQRRFEDAVSSWRGMAIDPEDSHVTTYSHILRALETATRQNAAIGDADSALHREIRQILKNHYGRWVMSSYDRLRQFGYRFDTF